MKGEFTVRIGNDIITYNDLNNIPLEFDNVIAFLPDYPPEPHTDEDHEYLETFVLVLDELMKREKR